MIFAPVASSRIDPSAEFSYVDATKLVPVILGILLVPDVYNWANCVFAVPRTLAVWSYAGVSVEKLAADVEIVPSSKYLAPPIAL